MATKSFAPAQPARQELADNGSKTETDRAVYRDADGNAFRGDDALFRALLNGATAKMAGVMAGVSERTVFRRLSDPEFARQLESARDAVRESIVARLTDAAGAAVDTLWHLLRSDEPSIRLAAAGKLLDALAKLQSTAPKQSTTVKYTVEQHREA